jgi:putative flippase GtrA
MRLRSFLKEFFIPKFKFAITSSIATALDYGVYIALTMLAQFSETASHAISYSLGMVVNFLLQKKFIFENNRKIGHSFVLSVIFSLIGWVLSQALFNFLINYVAFFKSYDLLAKVVVTITIFLYNFYSKRFSFERKMPWKR